MKKYWMLTAAFLMVLFLSMPSAFAVPVSVGQFLKFNYADSHYSVGGLNGGAFTVSTVSGGFLYETFCLETDEYITLNSIDRNKVDGISTTAYLGGSNTNSGDPLDYRTAYLYSKFWNSGFTMWNASQTKADLQEAIWSIEQELPATHTLSAAADALVQEAGTAGWTSYRGVKVVNMLWKNNDGNWVKGQDHLVVPEPSTILFLGLSLLGLGYVVRRERNLN